MEKKKAALGRGLDALFMGNEDVKTMSNSGVTELDIYQIDTNIKQPRKYFDEEKLNELAESISQHGIIEPIIVTKNGDRYIIVAGERRFRAARIAGLKKVPVIIREMAEDNILELALIENIQREDLNPIEEAVAIRYIMQSNKLNHEQTAERLGKSRAAVTNSLRLLNLPDSIHKLLAEGELQMGHAKVLLGAKEEIREQLAAQAAEEGWSVRMLEEKVSGKNKANLQKKKEKRVETRAAEIVEVENNMRTFLGTKVQLDGNENKGKIVINYYSRDTLEAIYNLICKEQ